MSIDPSRNYWFVGASRGGNVDKTDELIEQGIWRFWPGPEGKNAYEDKIRSMKPGDQIAIKAAYTRKHDLPFDNRDKPVSVMAIKAIGEIVENRGDGLQVKVDWNERFDPPKEWFFYTGRFSVWKMKKNDWAARGLIRFAFHDEPQDVERFLRHPFWQHRYGSAVGGGSRFAWTEFYEAFADRLAGFHDRRGELIQGLEKLSHRLPWLNYLRERESTRESGFLEDICPFTFMGAFNRGLTVENRRSIAAALADLIGLEMEAPESFDGIPVMNNQSAWFFAIKSRRKKGDIDGLWAMFREALEFSDAGEDQSARFIAAFDNTIAQRRVAWTLTMGLYWIRPWEFVPLDQNTRQYLGLSFGIELPRKIGEGHFAGSDYLELIEQLKERFAVDGAHVRSMPELSFAAWGKGRAVEEAQEEFEPDEVRDAPLSSATVEIESYGLEDIEAEGCFLPRQELEKILKRIRVKKNLILQGTPGTGKTWLSKRLAYALMGQRDDQSLTAVQFHPTLSYEDFVRGWRPAADGRLALCDGPLMQAIRRATEKPDSLHVVVIEEINRGNPAQIFGEMLTLIEGDKRKPEDALRLSHMHDGESPIHVPGNLYLIGTMNIADRSLALVDLALRRRFAFIDLAPQFNQAWAEWLEYEGGIDRRLVDDIGARMRKLNETITADASLGANFQVGHSYVTPGAGDRVRDPVAWFRAVVETEIGPLLEEYWFDRPERAREERERLLAGW